MSGAMRMLFLTIAALILIGIWLTGYQNVHWFIYVPPAYLLFSGITGFCPGLQFYQKLGFK